GGSGCTPAPSTIRPRSRSTSAPASRRSAGTSRSPTTRGSTARCRAARRRTCRSFDGRAALSRERERLRIGPAVRTAGAHGVERLEKSIALPLVAPGIDECHLLLHKLHHRHVG